MFPAALLSLEPAGGNTFVPRYLRSRDEVWVRRATSEMTDLTGMPRAHVDDAWACRVEPALRSFGAPRIAILGVKHVLDRACTWRVEARVDPRRIRDALFPIAARGGERAEILACASAALGVSPLDVDTGLFADRAGARVRAAASPEPTPSEVMLSYNLALVQGVLLRAERIRLDVSESVRPVVRYAKLRGLLASFDAVEEGWTRMHASGPLSLFRNTLKYGHALAGFFPTLTATPRYRLDALCRLEGRGVVVRIATGDPIPRTHALPREHDSAVERALARDLRRLSTTWSLERETTVLRAGTKLFFPDFALVRGQTRVLVEVVGYYTKEYLAQKKLALKGVGADRIIVCLDDALDCGDEGFADATVLRFRRRIDAARLLAVADSMGS